MACTAWGSGERVPCQVIPVYDHTRPYQQIPFQFSLHVREEQGGPITHHEFLAAGQNDPRRDRTRITRISIRLVTAQALEPGGDLFSKILVGMFLRFPWRHFVRVQALQHEVPVTKKRKPPNRENGRDSDQTWPWVSPFNDNQRSRCSQTA